MRTRNQILETKLNFLSQVTEEELFNHFFIRNQSIMIKLCKTALTSSRSAEVIKLASDILNIIDPNWFRSETDKRRKK